MFAVILFYKVVYLHRRVVVSCIWPPASSRLHFPVIAPGFSPTTSSRCPLPLKTPGYFSTITELFFYNSIIYQVIDRHFALGSDGREMHCPEYSSNLNVCFIVQIIVLETIIFQRQSTIIAACN